MAKLRAGAARVDMTPPVGIPLAGYWAPRPAEAIDTPLMAHAVVLDDGRTKLAVVALDLIALPAKDADQAKRRILDQTGLAPENVLICCSHTHEGPYPCPLLGRQTRVDLEYMAKVIDAVVESVVRAADGMGPAEVGFGSTQVGGICENRRRLKGPDDAFNVWALRPEELEKCPPAGPVDEELVLLAVRKASGGPLALLWNFTLHAHAFGGNSKRVCADYPYYVWQKLATALGGNLTSVYTAGACGDINRRAEADPQSIVDRLGEALIKLYGNLSFSSNVALRARLKTMDVPLRDFSVFQEQEIRRKLPKAMEVCREEWQILRELNERSVQTVVHAMAMGDFAVAAVPGEYFCALGLEVKKRSPFARTILAELSNDYVGYIPTAKAFDEGGYELFNLRSSKVARGTGERMAEELLRLLGELC